MNIETFKKSALMDEIKRQMLKSKKRKKHLENKKKREERVVTAKIRARIEGKSKDDEKDTAGLGNEEPDKPSESPKYRLFSSGDPIKSETEAGADTSFAARTRSGAKTKSTKSKSKPDTKPPRRRESRFKKSIFSSISDVDESDLNSDVSDISDDDVEEEIERRTNLAEIAAMQFPKPSLQNKMHQPVEPAESDGFEREDAWNAVVTVGLRVYVQESGVEVGIIREEWRDLITQDMIVGKNEGIDNLEPRMGDGPPFLSEEVEMGEQW